jgi:hypothetical protein
MAQKEAIMRALMEAMGSSPSAPMTSPRPPRRPRGLGEAGKTISDADRERIKGMMGRIPPVGKGVGGGDMELSPAQIKMLEQMIKQQNRVRDAEERKAFPPPSMMKNGGAVRKRKPKKGCVMKGRGGKYKGIK